MDSLIHKINLDCLRKDSQAIVNAKIGEASGRKIVFTLYEGRAPFFVPSDTTAVFRAKKPSGAVLYNNCVVDDGKIEYTITSQTVAEKGVFPCEIQIIGADNKVIYTPCITLNVTENLYSDTEVESSNEFTELENALNKIPSLEVINSKYTKPDGGIPKSDLAQDVQNSLSKADAALQEHQSLAAYRTAEAQDLIDSTKQDKLTAGKNITIADDGKTISATSGMDDVIGYFRVTLTERGDGLYTGSKTFAQVKAEIESNKRFMFIDGYDCVLIVTRVGNALIEFAGMSDGTDGWLWVGVASDERWEVVPEVRISLDWYNLLADDIGNTLNLTTADKSNLVAAINEVKQAADTKANVADLAPVATSGSYSDLTDKPTIPSVPTATINANAAARHEHSNKTVLDLISETVKAAWDAASTWVTTNGANVLSHLSDSIKHITTAERTAWNAKQDKLIAGDNITIAADGKTISATGGGGGVSGDNIETVEAQQIEIPSKLSDFENDSGFATNSAVEAALADKQDKISDLESIRSGAGKGVTALQAVPSTYRTASAQDVIDNGLSDRISAIEEKETGWNGKYSKPTGGIPKTDLAQAVQTSLSKADSALQSHQSLVAYRTASAQDSIDSGKVDKVVGKGLSTNDYTNAAKAKVDAIPANPKYTDTVYDDTAVKGRVSALESKLNGNGAVTFSAVTTDSLTTEGEVEIYGTQPHIDFHYNNSSDDYTSRIIETANGQLNLSAANGVKINGKKTENVDVTLTANTDRITNVSYTAKYNELLGAVFVRIYGKINSAMSAGYGYTIANIADAYKPNSNAALSVKIGTNDNTITTKDAAVYAKTTGAITIQPLTDGINSYDVYITGFWFV